MKKEVRGKFPFYSQRLTEDAFPRDMPEDLHPDMRGRWLLEYYGPPNMKDAIDEMLRTDTSNGCLGFVEDYFRIGQYVATLDCRTTIVDVGCAAGLQQVFFSQFAAYIGIDQYLDKSVKALQPNARFIEGNFATLVKAKSFVIEPTMFGIANRSLLYQDDNEASIAAFKGFKRLVMA
jgi:hypothetical protein